MTILELGATLRPGRHRRTFAWALALAALMVAGGCSNVPVHRTLPPLNLGEPAFFPTLETDEQTPAESLTHRMPVTVRRFP